MSNDHQSRARLNADDPRRVKQGEDHDDGPGSATPRMDVTLATGLGHQDAEAPTTAAHPTEVSRSVRDRLVRLAYRFLWNQDDAEDAVHDALAIAQQRGDELRDNSKWWSWMCRIVISRCHQQGRQKARHQRHEADIRRAHESAAEPAPPPDLGDNETVRRLIARLPARQREVLVLKHLQEMSYAEIAAVLGITASTARVHAKAAREALRELILADDPDWFDRDSKPSGALR